MNSVGNLRKLRSMNRVIAYAPAPTGPLCGDERKKRRAEFAFAAKKDFAEHTVTQIAPGIWSCSNRGSSNCRFEVVFLGHRVIVTGDIGDLVLYCSDSDARAWLRQSVKSMDYVLRKCSSNIKKYVYEQDLARALILEHEIEAHREMTEYINDTDLTVEEKTAAAAKFDEIHAKLDTVREHLDTEDEFIGAWIDEICPQLDYPNATDWSTNAMWCYYALVWLVEQAGEKLLDTASFPPAPKVRT